MMSDRCMQKKYSDVMYLNLSIIVDASETVTFAY